MRDENIFQIQGKKRGVGGSREKEVRSSVDGEKGRSGVSFEDSNSIFENRSERWLTTREAAEFLRITPKSLLNLTSNGRIRFYKFGRSNRFLASELSQLLLAQPRGGF